mmetsp:Transcript_9409/g.14023  ORF Transcript_9409/g.14023 Transcript_9409/m.14023 type:complete len:748 (-) Transcript_9409:180-2423(-)|eukprot:CAMPEP_0203677150 /NCGR_PEP_ID=MMETSP0090-20130426/27215_1 /ASSEMBLY_ACC=CAM_ASM_001088 /TAXON_ID=426623 /ORGANISM="Chaetoceros affinis, Strain CCMP159" /LENGTH=747 /DNA_ID=CAMNT_0050543955 /DNA_START=30 /DNA_END=2273 /DNA_ORIENTATION=-
MGIQGIIRPPPEIRAVADKTAAFVAKRGRDFETRIINSAKGKTPKFAFLYSSSPFHAYYEDRIVFFMNGGSDEKKEEKKQEEDGTTNANDDKQKGVDASTSADTNKKEDEGTEEKGGKDGVGETIKKQVGELTNTARKAKSIVDPVAKALLAQRAIIKEMNEPPSKPTKGENKTENDDAEQQGQEMESKPLPPRQIYTTPIPPKSISQSQLEIIKLTAQFIALTGGSKNSFLRELTHQEWGNPLYGFLQPRHGDYAYFTQLVDIYRRILQRTVVMHEKKITQMKKMKQEGGDVSTSTSLLTMISLKKMVGIDNANTEKDESLNQQLHEEIRSIENMAGNMHKCLDYAAYQAEYDRYNEEKRQEELEKMMNEGGDGFLGGSARVDWHDFVVVETIDFAVDEVVEALPPPPPPLPKEEVEEKKPPAADNDDMEASSDEEDREEIEVVPDYTPKVVSSQAKFASESRTHVIDPITKKSIPIADMTEHMRIQLLDPKWAAEKERFMEKQKDSNLVGGDMIARNVDAFTRARGDLFGSSTNEIANQEESAKRRLEEANRLIREQSVAPEPSAAVEVAPLQVPATSVTRERPQMDLPDPKRVRVEDVLGAQKISLQMPPPVQVQATLQQQQPPPPSDEKDTEVIQTTKLSEGDFARSLPDPLVTLSIIVPNDESYPSWNFNGQTLSISVDVMTKIKGLKQKLQAQLGDMPLNKMQLKSPDIGFLKDAFSLAKLNIGSHSKPIELVPKVRGGRK